MKNIATKFSELRFAVGDVDALAAVTLAWFDNGDWSGADQLLVERTGFMLMAIAKAAVTAAAKLDSFHMSAAVVGREPGA